MILITGGGSGKIKGYSAMSKDVETITFFQDSITVMREICEAHNIKHLA
jgi:hypothetical protein